MKKRIKIRNINKNMEKKTMTLKMEELLEFENALKTVKEYETKINIPLIKTKTFQRVMNMITESKKQKRETELSERIENLEKTVSKIANSDLMNRLVDEEIKKRENKEVKK